jgi:hypothetical protein
MELNKVEAQAIEKAFESEPTQLLNDLQLALVGGGIGETIL